MATLKCVDCGKEVERANNAQKRCVSCAPAANLKKQAEWRARPEVKAAKVKWDAEWYANPEIKAAKAKRGAEWNANHKEYASVQHHHWLIFKSKNPRYRTYKGMLFFNGWNPDKDGSLQAGANWIIENLGKRPEGKVSLDVVHHEIGFMPGNLRWSEPRGQEGNKMHKVISKLKQDNEHLKLLVSENPFMDSEGTYYKRRGRFFSRNIGSAVSRKINR